ncbi:MAG: 50S ribosomal protein L1 [Patescibacteria group bacterium]
MENRSKRFKQEQGLVDAAKTYSPEEAIGLAKKTSAVKFDAGVEVHVRLGIDVAKADQIVRGTVALPHGTGKTKRVAVFCEGKDQEAATKAGAALVGADELIKQIQTTGKCDFDIALATPAMMKKLSPVAKILGPKGLMPNPRNETITKDVAAGLNALAAGKVTFRNDDSGNIHQLVGRVSFDQAKLLENFKAFMEALKRVKPQGAKGIYIRNVVISTTMGPGIKVQI